MRALVCVCVCVCVKYGKKCCVRKEGNRKATKAHVGITGLAPLILNHVTGWKEAKFTLRSLYPRERTPVHIAWEEGCGPEVVWTF